MVKLYVLLVGRLSYRFKTSVREIPCRTLCQMIIQKTLSPRLIVGRSRLLPRCLGVLPDGSSNALFSYVLQPYVCHYSGQTVRVHRRIARPMQKTVRTASS